MSSIKNNKKFIYAVKFLTYFAIIYAFYILQTTPGFLKIGGVKPMLLAPVAVCIAMWEDEFIGGIFGAVIGMLCDLASYNIFGFNAIIFLICSVGAGLLTIYLIQNKASNAVLLTGGLLIVRGFMEYYFNYALWIESQSSIVLIKQILPTIVYSLVFAAPTYYLIKFTKEYFDTRLSSHK